MTNRKRILLGFLSLSLLVLSGLGVFGVYKYVNTPADVDPEYYYTSEFIESVPLYSTCVEGDEREGCQEENAINVYIDCDFEYVKAPDSSFSTFAFIYEGVYTEEIKYHNKKICESLKTFIDRRILVNVIHDVNDGSIDQFIRINPVPYEDFENTLGQAKVAYFFISDEIDGDYQRYIPTSMTGHGIAIFGTYWRSHIRGLMRSIEGFEEDRK